MKLRLYRFLQAGLAVLFLLLIAPSFQQPRTTQKGLSTIMEKTLSGIDMSCYPLQDALSLRRYVNLNPSDFEETVFYRTSNAMDAEEIVAAKFSGEATRQAFEEAVRARQQQQMSTFMGYAPAQYEMTSQGKIIIEGNTGLYVTGPQADQIASQFKAAL